MIDNSFNLEIPKSKGKKYKKGLIKKFEKIKWKKVRVNKRLEYKVGSSRLYLQRFKINLIVGLVGIEQSSSWFYYKFLGECFVIFEHYRGRELEKLIYGEITAFKKKSGKYSKNSNKTDAKLSLATNKIEA